jgi:hypothetical protein
MCSCAASDLYVSSPFVRNTMTNKKTIKVADDAAIILTVEPRSDHTFGWTAIVNASMRETPSPACGNFVVRRASYSVCNATAGGSDVPTAFAAAAAAEQAGARLRADLIREYAQLAETLALDAAARADADGVWCSE